MVYVVAGNTLSLSCAVNGTSLSVRQVSWKHEREWLHNQTQRSASVVHLVIRRVARQQAGDYQCSVFSYSGQSQNKYIPKDANVNVLVGGKSSLHCMRNFLVTLQYGSG